MIHLHIPSVPISSNHAYESITRRVKGKGKVPKIVISRRLSSEGERYKRETKTYIARHFPSELKFFRPNIPYTLVVRLTFKGRDTLYTKGWDDPKKQVKSRYKTLDVTNRTKLFEDALAEATGLNDSQNFSVTVVKSWHRDFEATDVWVWCPEEEYSPLDEFFGKLVEQPQPHGAVPNLPTGGHAGAPTLHES